MHRRPCSTPPGRGRLRHPWVIYRGIRQRSPIRRDREVIYRESRPGQMRGALRHRPGRRWEPSAGGRARAFSASLCAGDAVRASGGRSWPSQSEAGAARTRFPRRPPQRTRTRAPPDDPSGVRHRASPRPHNGRRHRASARPRNGWRLHASAFSGTFHRVDQVPSPTRLLQVLFPRNSFRIKAPLYLPTTRKAETTWFLAST